jgi:SWI/SNF-related matrix-associated actin-dependent regulator 1 of chromatin subfamily A
MRLVAEFKLSSTERWIKEFFERMPDSKLVALTMNTFVIDHLLHKFPNTVIIDGRITGQHRTQAVRLFQTNPRVKLLLGNWRAAGVGITLTAAHYAVSLDFPWTPGDLVQGEDRIHRIGQKKNVLIYYLVAMNTIEEKLMKILRKKSSVLDAVLDGRIEANNLNIFDELIDTVRKDHAKHRV